MEMCKILINKIEKLCDTNNITINQMLSKCGLAKDVVNNMKKEKPSIPSVDKIYAISQYFNVSSDYLLGLDDVPNRKEEKPTSELTDLEQELLEKFNHLLDVDKGRILDRMETIYESYNPEQKESVS